MAEDLTQEQLEEWGYLKEQELVAKEPSVKKYNAQNNTQKSELEENEEKEKQVQKSFNRSNEKLNKDTREALGILSEKLEINEQIKDRQDELNEIKNPRITRDKVKDSINKLESNEVLKDSLDILKEKEQVEEQIKAKEKEIKEKFEEDNNLLIAVSEGFMDKDGKLLNEKQKSFDKGFNHPIIAGIGLKISDYIHDKLKVKTRSVELNIVQRTSFLISKTDSDEAYQLGYLTIKYGKEKTNLVPILKRENSKDYKVKYFTTKPSNIANKEKKIPQEWLESREILKEKITNYTLPLIKGEIDQEFTDGIFDYIRLEDFTKNN